MYLAMAQLRAIYPSSVPFAKVGHLGHMADMEVKDAMKAGVLKSVQLDMDWSVQTVLPIEFKGREVMLEAHAYQGEAPEEQALVLIHRDPDAPVGTLPIVRVHSGCVTGDIFHSLRCDCYQQLQEALRVITEVPLGAIIYVPYHEGRGIGLFKKIKAYALQDQGMDTVEANIEVGEPIDSRDYELAARILADLGMDEVKLLSNNPAKEQALKALGVKVAERVPIVISPNPHNQRYLDTKRRRMAHKI